MAFMRNNPNTEWICSNIKELVMIFIRCDNVVLFREKIFFDIYLNFYG